MTKTKSLHDAINDANKRISPLSPARRQVLLEQGLRRIAQGKSPKQTLASDREKWIAEQNRKWKHAVKKGKK